MPSTPISRGYLHEDFRLFHNRDTLGTDVELHYHEFYKLLVLLEGNGSYIIEGHRYSLRAGDVILIGQLVPHKPEFEAGILYDRYTFFISQALLERYSTEDCALNGLFTSSAAPVFRPRQEARERILRLVRAVEAEISSDAYGSAPMARARLVRLLAELGRSNEERRGTAVKATRSRDGKILPILRYLDAHVCEQIAVPELAERFYMSQFHMMRRFKDEVGTSVHEYLSERRLLLARRLLQEGHSATDACYASGFRSYSSFARAYKKHFGISPKTGAESAEEQLQTQYTE